MMQEKAGIVTLSVLLLVVSSLLGSCTQARQLPRTAYGPPPTVQETSHDKTGDRIEAVFVEWTPGWNWHPQLAPSLELAELSARLKTPGDINDWMKNNLQWYNSKTEHVSSPDDMLILRRGLCTEFARFWAYLLNAHGIKTQIVGVWSDTTAHAVVLFQDDQLNWRMTSNAKLQTAALHKDFEVALVDAAITIYGAGWLDIRLFDPISGKTTRRIHNTPLAPVTAGTPNSRFILRL